MKKVVLFIISIVAVLVTNSQTYYPLYNNYMGHPGSLYGSGGFTPGTIMEDTVNKAIIISGTLLKTDLTGGNLMNDRAKIIKWVPSTNKIYPGTTQSNFLYKEVVGGGTTNLSFTKPNGNIITKIENKNSYYNHTTGFFDSIIPSQNIPFMYASKFQHCVNFNGTYYMVGPGAVTTDSSIVKWNGTKFIPSGLILSSAAAPSNPYLIPLASTNSIAGLYVFQGNLYYRNGMLNSNYTIVRISSSLVVTPLYSTKFNSTWGLGKIPAPTEFIEFKGELYVGGQNSGYTDVLVYKLDPIADTIKKKYTLWKSNQVTSGSVYSFAIVKDTLFIAGMLANPYYTGSISVDSSAHCIYKLYNDSIHFMVGKGLTKSGRPGSVSQSYIGKLYYSKQFNSLIIFGCFETIAKQSIQNLAAIQYKIQMSISTINVTNPQCNGGNGTGIITVIDGKQPYTFNWSNGSTTISTGNVPAGIYSLTVTDADGDTLQKTITITQPSAITSTVTTTNESTCSSQLGTASILASGGTGNNYSYSWSTGVTTQLISNLSNGGYFVIIRDSIGCSITTNVTILKDSPINITINKTDESMPSANDGNATSIITGGSPSYSYNWSNNSTNSSISNLTGGVYTLTITDSKGCTSIKSTTIITHNPSSINNEINSNQNLVIYPNPTVDGNINITLNSHGKLQIYNLIGSLIQEISITTQFNNNVPVILNFNEKGTYLIVYLTETGTSSQKVVFQ